MTSLLWSGCDFLDKEEQIPSYIYIESIDLDTNSITEGSNKHDIKDAWVSVNEKFVGIYPLPALVPVLEADIQEVQVLPGISVSGLSDFRVTYPVYTSYKKDIDLTAGEIDTIKPIVSYDDDVVFLLIEDFETSNIMTNDIDDNQYTKVIAKTNDVFEGSKSGEIELTNSNPFIEVGSNLTYLIPDPDYVYLEVNYKTEVDLEFGLISYKTNEPFDKQYLTGVFPSDEWRKIYIDITNDLRAMTTDGGEEFRIAIRAFNSSDDNAYVYLDNIKLIYQ